MSPPPRPRLSVQGLLLGSVRLRCIRSPVVAVRCSSVGLTRCCYPACESGRGCAAAAAALRWEAMGPLLLFAAYAAFLYCLHVIELGDKCYSFHSTLLYPPRVSASKSEVPYSITCTFFLIPVMYVLTVNELCQALT